MHSENFLNTDALLLALINSWNGGDPHTPSKIYQGAISLKCTLFLKSMLLNYVYYGYDAASHSNKFKERKTFVHVG